MTVQCFQSTNSRWTIDTDTMICRREPAHADAEDEADVPYLAETFTITNFEVDDEGYLRKVYLPLASSRALGFKDGDGTWLGCYAKPVLP